MGRARAVRASVAAALLAVAAGLFLRQRRRPIPLPPSLSFVLENPVTAAVVAPAKLVDRLDPAPGMRVLDAGCGPGRVAVEAARRVTPGGEVVALDSQDSMLRRLDERLRSEGIQNVAPVRGELGAGELARHRLAGTFDRVIMAMVLGEIRERRRALGELYEATRPGGVVSVTEALGDPDYRGRSTVRREVESAGFRFVRLYDGRVSFTMNFTKPDRPG